MNNALILSWNIPIKALRSGVGQQLLRLIEIDGGDALSCQYSRIVCIYLFIAKTMHHAMKISKMLKTLNIYL